MIKVFSFGAYNYYIWPAYGLAFTVFVGQLLWLKWYKSQLIRKLKRMKSKTDER